MLTRRILALVLVAASAVIFTGSTAQAAQKFNYVGWSGGTMIHAIGSTLTSDLTAQSYVAGIKVPNAATNNAAVIDVGDLARTGAVETSEKVVAHDDGVRLISHARTANVNLLGGLIRADAVETRNTTTAIPGEGMRTRAFTRFVDLRIGSLDLPVDIPKNYKVSIKGVATIVANGQETEKNNGIVKTHGYGLKIVLLSAFRQAEANSVIFLNPTFAGMAPAVPVDAPRLAGHAFGTRVHTTATSEVQIDSGRSANITSPPGGTNDATVSNSTAAVNIRRILNTGAVFSTTRGLTYADYGEVTNVNEIAGVSLLGGLITADAIKTRAHAKRVDNKFSGSQKMTFVNLVIGGREIPLDVSPNTKISLGDLAVVTINKRYRTTQSVGITGIHIKLLKPRGAAPAGAIIEVSQALAWILPSA